MEEGSLGWYQAMYRRMIDADASNARARHMTTGAGMEMTYQEKFAQAGAVIQAGEPAAIAMTEAQAVASYPTLAASIGVEAPTLWDCAELVIVRYSQWAQLSYAIERTRLATKKSISDASTVEAAKAAYEAAQWPT